MVDKVDNDTLLEAECGCVKPCNFINPVLVQEFSEKMPGWGTNNRDKGEKKNFQSKLGSLVGALDLCVDWQRM